MSEKFPIKDVQFHEERIREIASDTMTYDEALAVSWHSTAIAHLQYGHFKNLQGPAAEVVVPENQVCTAEIEDYLLPAKDRHGQPYFKYVIKKILD